MPSTMPTYARVSSLSHWSTFFHSTDGLFRLPSTEGKTIEHLDIDLRFVEHDAPRPASKVVDDAIHIPHSAEIYLPNVSVVTLRGAEHVHDSDERIDCLAEVLLAIKPYEVRWINATSDPTEQLTFSTHLVHPAIIAAGEIWARNGGARRLVIQGGFPCPNLSAPTPFSLTPAATPCHSPGPTKTSFGASISSLPALSTIKPKPVDENKLKERAERKRLAEYSLKPRFEFAFGSWGSEVIHWSFDGRYTPACILASIEHLFNAFNKTFPSPSSRDDLDMPSVITFAPLPKGIIESIRGLTTKLELDSEIVTYLVDSVFFTTKSESTEYARLFEGLGLFGIEHKDRQARRIKAEMLMIQSKFTIVPISITSPERKGSSMSDSTNSLLPDETYATTEDEGEEAVTPEMGNSIVLPPLKEGKVQAEGGLTTTGSTNIVA